MKHVIYFQIILLFTGISCRTKKTFPSDVDFETGKGPNEINLNESYSISGTVTHSNSYCGGARPTDEMLKQITAPKPTSNATFYVRKGIQNDPGMEIFQTFKTDENGNFRFELPPGDYVIIEQNRLDSTYYFQILKSYSKETNSYTAADTSCMNDWLKGSLMRISVINKDVQDLNWDTHHGCWTDVPCIHYKGPYPP